MIKTLKGYLYKDKIVVINKSDIKNAEDKNFKEINLCINEKDIRNWAEELELMDDEYEEEELN